ncbi:hypothetical protein Tco_1236062 [Tanacetum coccineum]
MSETVPPIPPPPGGITGSPSSPNINRVDTMPNTETTNTTPITNRISQFWKIRFLVFLDGHEPYLLQTLKDGPFVPMSNMSTPENPLPKRQNQWSNIELRLDNQDKRLKSIIISCLPNDVMKSVIKYKSSKEMWNELVRAYEGPSNTRDTKIAALRLKFNVFKALEGHEGLIDDIYESETQRFSIQASSSKALVSNTHPQDSNPDVKKDIKTSNEFMADLNANIKKELCWQIRKDSTRGLGGLDLLKNLQINPKDPVSPVGNLRIDDLTKGDEDITKFKAFMVIVKDEPSMGKLDTRSGQWVKITMQKDEISNLKNVIKKWACSKVTLGQLLSEQIAGNIVKELGGKGRRKENNSPKEVIFTKANESSSELIPEVISDSKADYDNLEPLLSLLKLIRAKPSSSLNSLVSLSDLTSNMTNLTLNSSMNVNSSTEQLLLTPIEEIKGIKYHKIPSVISSSDSQASSYKPSKQKA